MAAQHRWPGYTVTRRQGRPVLPQCVERDFTTRFHPNDSSFMDIKILIYWVIVGVPLSWGLYKSIERSKPLFAGAPPAAAVAPAATPAAPAPSATPR